METITCLLFDDFEALDLFGPLEVFSLLPEFYRIQFASTDGRDVYNKIPQLSLSTYPYSQLPNLTDILLVVGGIGSRDVVNDELFIKTLRALANQARWILSVCTGSALLAKSGVLAGIKATSNKRAWPWVIAQSDKVFWQPNARWVVDDRFYSAAGISAGIDMALGFVSDIQGLSVAKDIANRMEYHWNQHSEQDEFQPIHF